MITAVPVVSPMGAMPQNSSATHPVMPGEPPAILSGFTREKTLQIHVGYEAVPLASNHSTSSFSMSSKLCHIMDVSIDSPWLKK